MTSRVRTTLALAAALTLTACPAAETPAPADAGTDRDVSTQDTSSPEDTGRVDDSGAAEDSGTSDMGAADTGSGEDAATEEDAGVEDTGVDTGGEEDGGACPWVGEQEIGDSPMPNLGGSYESTRADGHDDEYLIDPTGAFKVGIRQDWGGSIVFFGSKGAGPGMNGTNTIDANDTGREVQVALYDPDRRMQGCAWDASCLASPTMCPNSITYLGWNPVQGGNRCNNGSDPLGVTRDAGRLSVSTIPKQWNPNWEAQTCISDGCQDQNISRLDSDVRLDQHLSWVGPRVVELRYTVENLAAIDHAPTVQEMPTLYTAIGQVGPDLWRLFDAAGREITIDNPANDGFFNKDFSSPEPWVLMQNDALDYGVGILYENGIRDFQGWQNRNLPFNNVRARFAFGLPANGVVHARAYLLLGSQATIAADATALLATLAPFGVMDVPAAGQPASGTTRLSGWVLDNRGVASVHAVVDEGTRVDMTHGQSRADVCLAWPGYPDCPNVGWSGSVELPPSECPHKVEVFATDTDGNTRLIARRLIASR